MFNAPVKFFSLEQDAQQFLQEHPEIENAIVKHIPESFCYIIVNEKGEKLSIMNQWKKKE